MLAQTQSAPVRSSRRSLLPGIGLCVLVTAVAYLCQETEIRLVGRPWLEAAVTVSLVVLGAISLGLIHLIGVA